MWAIEALRRDGSWHYSQHLLIKYLKGDFDGEEIDQVTASIAFKNLGGLHEAPPGRQQGPT
jgi:hypothetical protein